MATWHQRLAHTRLYHDSEWTVVEDPPNDCRALQTFSTCYLAEAHRDRIKALHPTWRVYVLQPGNPRR